jgi:hypothetical protein
MNRWSISFRKNLHKKILLKRRRSESASLIRVRQVRKANASALNGPVGADQAGRLPGAAQFGHAGLPAAQLEFLTKRMPDFPRFADPSEMFWRFVPFQHGRILLGGLAIVGTSLYFERMSGQPFS